MRIILVIVISLLIVSCATKRYQATADAVEYVVAQLPDEFNYLLPKNGDTMDVLVYKLKASHDELMRIQAGVSQTRDAGAIIIEELD